MVAISKGEVEEIVTPHLARLQQAILGGVNGYYRMYRDLRPELSLRSEASICHDRIVSLIQDQFSGVRGARCAWRKGLFLLVLNEVVAMRFKKFDRRLLAHGIETQQTIAFNFQEPEQLELPDMPPYGLLYVGYTLNALNTGVEGVYITCRFGKRNIWKLDITPVHEVEIPQLPISQLPQRRVTVRGRDYGSAAEQGHNENGS